MRDKLLEAIAAAPKLKLPDSTVDADAITEGQIRDWLFAKALGVEGQPAFIHNREQWHSLWDLVEKRDEVGLKRAIRKRLKEMEFYWLAYFHGKKPRGRPVDSDDLAEYQQWFEDHERGTSWRRIAEKYFPHSDPDDAVDTVRNGAETYKTLFKRVRADQWEQLCPDDKLWDKSLGLTPAASMPSAEAQMDVPADQATLGKGTSRSPARRLRKLQRSGLTQRPYNGKPRASVNAGRSDASGVVQKPNPV